LGNSTTTTSSGLAAIGGVSVATRAAALAAQGQVDGYLQTVNIVSGQIGSALSRFEVASRVLGTSSENFRAAESRITDVDVAEVSGAYQGEHPPEGRGGGAGAGQPAAGRGTHPPR
jgi:flagellin-like hook-associated protein FlgL